MAPSTRRRQSQIRRYSRAVRWMKILLPLGAAAMIALIFLTGKDRSGAVDADSPVGLAALSAGLTLENPRFAGVTQGGEAFLVTARSALPDGAVPNLIGLDQPEGEIELGDGLTLTARARNGEMYRTDEQLKLFGDVVVESSDGYRAETDRVDVDLDRRNAVVPGRIRAAGPRGSLEADRARMDQGPDGKGNLILLFEGHVKLTILPGTGN